MLKRCIFVIITGILCCLFLSGCEEVQIFQKKTDPNALVAVKDTDLVKDEYYVKENTNFYKTYLPGGGNAFSRANSLDESRVLITGADDSLIPPHYSDEFIAYSSDKIDLDYIVLERFKDLGSTIGCFGGTMTEDGFMYYNRNSQVVADSSFDRAIGKTNSYDIRISSINGKPIDIVQVDIKSGVICGFEKGKTYKLGFYVGTQYYEKDVVADSNAYAAYEMFFYDDSYIRDTPNGYMCFSTPTDLKPGIYNINGKGLFKYYNFPRGIENTAEVDMNESYYKDERSKIEAYSRQYSVQVPNRVQDFKITVDYSFSESVNSDDVIEGIVFAPDGERMDMEVDESHKQITIALAEAMAGEWTVNIIPKTLNIENVSVDNDKAIEEATCEETQFTLPENRENVEFIAEYTISRAKAKDCTIFGTVTTEDGKTYEMEVWADTADKNSTHYYISYELPFAGAGDYTVRIYHYPEETTIGTPELRDKMVTDTEIIIVDG